MSARRMRGMRDYASHDSYLRDQGLCPEHLRCMDARHPCVLCEIEKEEQEERAAAIAKDDYYNADGYAVWEDKR